MLKQQSPYIAALCWLTAIALFIDTFVRHLLQLRYQSALMCGIIIWVDVFWFVFHTPTRKAVDRMEMVNVSMMKQIEKQQVEVMNNEWRDG